MLREGSVADSVTQERELHLTSANANDLRAQVEKRDRRTRELEEQIQNDDRVERLEKLLQNTQSRADELEFQLSKLGQVKSLILPITSFAIIKASLRRTPN